jgi:hypothetical protein
VVHCTLSGRTLAAGSALLAADDEPHAVAERLSRTLDGVVDERLPFLRGARVAQTLRTGADA